MFSCWMQHRYIFKYIKPFLGPLISYVGGSDPSIVFNAYVITLIVFGSFTMAALHAESTKFLHLGGFFSLIIS